MIRPRSLPLPVCVGFWGLTVLSTFGQGSLIPSGTPAPTMKTLDQIEARTPIPANAATVTISADGSYYLTGNVTVATGDGIDITANNVTLDLNGFAVVTTSTASGSGAAINCTGGGSLVVRNGHLAGTVTLTANSHTFPFVGFAYGVLVGANARSARIEAVDITGIGTDGVNSTAASTLISHCQANQVGNFAFNLPTATERSVVERCTIQACGGGILGGVVAGCVVETVGGNIGITAATVSDTRAIAYNNTAILGETVINCTGTSTSGNFSAAVIANEATNCHGYSYNGPGLRAAISATGCAGFCNNGNSIGLQAVVATNCTGGSATGTGLLATNATNCTGSTNGVAGTTVYAIDCNGGVASFCTANTTTATGGALPLRAKIATSCALFGPTGTITNRYNMPATP